MSENFLVGFIRNVFEKEPDKTFDMSNILQDMYPEVRGFSTRNIKRLCSKHGITRRAVVAEGCLDNAVRQAVREIRWITGYQFI